MWNRRSQFKTVPLHFLIGGQVGDMVLWPLGGFVICGPVDSVIADFKVAIAGPLTHLPQMAFWLVIFFCIEGSMEGLDRIVDTSAHSFGAILSAQAFFLNLILFVFNLFVPAPPRLSPERLATPKAHR